MTEFSPGDEVVVVVDLCASLIKLGDKGVVANPAYHREGSDLYLQVRHSDGNIYGWNPKRWRLAQSAMPDTREYLNALSRIGR